MSRLRIGQGRSSVLLIERLSVGALWVAPEKLGPGRLMSDERALEAGPCQRFSDWPNQSVPKVAAGVYTVWEDGRLIYVGMSGRALTSEDIDAPDEPTKPKGSMGAAVRLRRSCCNPSRTLTTLTVHSCAAIEEQGRFVQLSAQANEPFRHFKFAAGGSELALIPALLSRFYTGRPGNTSRSPWLFRGHGSRRLPAPQPTPAAAPHTGYANRGGSRTRS